MGAKARCGLAVTELSRVPNFRLVHPSLLPPDFVLDTPKGGQGDPGVGSLEIDWTTQRLGTKETHELGKKAFPPLVCGGLFAPHERRVSQ